MLLQYICELVLVDYEKYLVFPSSLVAASALCVANYTLNVQDCWVSLPMLLKLKCFYFLVVKGVVLDARKI